MKKFFLLYFLFLSGFSFAVELSDDEKRTFIESLAKPSSETQVFYRWQPESVKKELLEAGEMNTELYKYYMEKEFEIQGVISAGQGFYVAEDMSSSSHLDETIVKVVLKKGYPFIDLNDARVQRQLQEKGIGLKEAYLLNPRVAVRDGAHPNWWCLKRQRGIRFKPISNQELMKHFKKASLSVGVGGKSRFLNILPPQERRILIDNIENVVDGLDLLFAAKASQAEEEALANNTPSNRFNFSQTEIVAIANVTLTYVTNAKEGVLFLQIGWEILSKEDKNKIMDKILSYIQTERDMEALHREIKKQFIFAENYNQVFTEFQAVLQQKAEQVKSNSILPDFSKTFSKDELEALSSDRSASSTDGLLSLFSEDELRTSDQEQVARGSVISGYSQAFSKDELREIRGEGRNRSSESRLEVAQNRENRIRSDESQNHFEKPHERKLREAIRESLTSGKDIGGAVHEYVLESIRCSSNLWKSH